MTAEGPDPLAAVRAAFLDTFDRRSARDGRCIHFLMPGWFDVQVAKRAAHLIGPYGTFDPDIVTPKLDDIEEADPTAKFCFGREGSVTLYVACDYPEPILHILETTHPQELYQLSDGDHVNEIVDEEQYRQSHEHCFHEGGPPTPPDELPIQHDNRAYVRAWWDND